MHVSINKLQLKSIWKRWEFINYNHQVLKQIKISKGLLSVDTKGSSFTEFYTLTSWKSEDVMLTFVRNGAHAEAMKASPQFASEIITDGYESEVLPSWTQAMNHLQNKNNP